MLTPAAQYLRMSTDQQQYSLPNQAAAIAQYAERHGFNVVTTYKDEGRSGLRANKYGPVRVLNREVPRLLLEHFYGLNREVFGLNDKRM